MRRCCRCRRGGAANTSAFATPPSPVLRPHGGPAQGLFTALVSDRYILRNRWTWCCWAPLPLELATPSPLLLGPVVAPVVQPRQAVEWHRGRGSGQRLLATTVILLAAPPLLHWRPAGFSLCQAIELQRVQVALPARYQVVLAAPPLPVRRPLEHSVHRPAAAVMLPPRTGTNVRRCRGPCKATAALGAPCVLALAAPLLLPAGPFRPG